MNNQPFRDSCQTAFWELVRCGLSGATPKNELFSMLDDKMWEDVYRQVRVQAVIGICYQAVRALPKAYQPSWPLLVKWHVQTNYIVAVNEKQCKVWIEINRRLRKAGIRPVLLKGMSIASYYPSPMLRVSGDLDVYVEEFDRTISVVESWGLQIKRGAWHHQFSYEGVDVELHHTYWGQEQTPDDCFKEVDTLEGSYTVLDEQRNARLQIGHIIHHLLGGGVGVRHLCDWAVFLDQCRQRLDFGRLEDYFIKHQSASFVHVFSALAVKRLGKEEILPLFNIRIKNERKLLQILEQDMLKYGNFGTGNPEVDTVEFKRLPMWERWKIVWCRIVRAWRFRTLCPIDVKDYIRSMVRYVCNSIVSGRAFSHQRNKK